MTTDRSVVFVVDDDVRVREALSDLLASAGLDVAVFASATEFLDADKPDAAACLVLDLELPDIHGLELQKELAEREAAVEILLERARSATVTLVYAAKDEEHNGALVLKDYLEARQKRNPSRRQSPTKRRKT